MVHWRRVGAFLLVFAVAGGGACGETVYPYQVIDLGTLGGAASTAYAINASGQVTGTADTPNLSGTYAFLWSESGGMTNLGTAHSGEFSWGFAINDAGWVVGQTGVYASLYTPSGGMQDLGTLGTGTRSKAHDVNNAGVVVGGGSTIGDAYSHAFVWDSVTGLRDLNSLITNPPTWTPTSANAINDSGQIVGIGYDTISTSPPSGRMHAFTLDSGILTEILAPGSVNIQPQDVNSLGVVTGTYFPASGSRAFVYSLARGLEDIGTLGGAIANSYAVNDQGEIVGVSLKSDGTAAAFLYDANGTMTDLNTLVAPSGWDLFLAYDINNSGQIAGVGYNPDGLRHAFLLVPTATPEPGAAVLLAAGAFLALAVRLVRLSLARRHPAVAPLR